MSAWTLTAVFLGGSMRLGCLGGAIVAQEATIAPLGAEFERILKPTDLAGLARDLVILNPIEGILWRSPETILQQARKWAVRWIERRGGRVERFAFALARPGHEASWIEGLRIILPAEEISRSMAKLRRVTRILARAVRGAR